MPATNKPHLNTCMYTDNSMAAHTISIPYEAYQRLKNQRLKNQGLKNQGLKIKRGSKKDSLSDKALKYYPSRRTLSEVLSEIIINGELVFSIEAVSKSMRCYIA